MEPLEIACTLSSSNRPGRVEEWRAVLAAVVERTAIDGGARLRFGPSADVGRIADLASRELACCSFFEFSLRLSRTGLTLDVRAPAEAEGLVDALFADATTAAPECGCSSR